MCAGALGRGEPMSLESQAGELRVGAEEINVL